MKNKTIRVLKLYLTSNLNPVTTVVGLFLLIMIPVLMAIDPVPVGDKEYMSMIFTVSISKTGIILIQFMSFINSSRSKFHLSLPQAKEYFTRAPLAVSLLLCFAYDAAVICIAMTGSDRRFLSDIIIMCAVSTFCFNTAICAIGKKGLEVLSCLFLVWSLCSLPGMSSILGVGNNGFGLSVGKAAALAAVITAANIAINILIMDLWWKKGDRAYKNQGNSIMNAR